MTQALFLGLLDNGYIFARTELGAISPSTGRTLPDRYIEGTCPICGYPSARGDQCDNCGNQLDPADLIDPKSKINGETPKFVETEQFFLDLPAFAEVISRLAARPVALAAQRAEVRAEPAGRPQAAGHHPRPGLGRPGAAGGLARPRGQADLRLVRRGDRLPVGLDRVGGPVRRPGRLAGLVAGHRDGSDARQYYFMGKDNIVFHAEIWPAMLFGYSGIGAKGGKPGSWER